MKKESANRICGQEVQCRRCRCEREDGTPCKANVQAGSLYCFFHDPSLDAERAAARKAGGIARSRTVMLPANAPAKSLQTVAEVIDLLGETINQVRRGEIDLRVSNAIGYLSGLLLNAIEKRSFEGRLAALEAAVTNQTGLNNHLADEESSFEFHPMPRVP